MKKIFNTVLGMIFKDLTQFGGLIFLGVIILLSLILGNINLALNLSFGLIFTALITILIRLIYFKNRPKKQNYSNLLEKLDASSFPSLHTARIIFIALTLAIFFKNNLVTAFLLVMAILVSYSRIYLKKHDYYDLLGGFILGIITYYLAHFLF